jgi:hypothetical protein
VPRKTGYVACCMRIVSPGAASTWLIRSRPWFEPEVIKISSVLQMMLSMELLAEELAQSDIAERAAVEAVGGERRPLTLQHGRGCDDQPVNGRSRRIVVAADEVERREAGVFDGSWR